MENMDPRQEAITKESRAAVTDEENSLAAADTPVTAEERQGDQVEGEPEADDSGENPTMEQLLNNPKHDYRSLKYGDVLEGRIMKVDPEEILVDIGSKSEGIIPSKEMQSLSDEERKALRIGDEMLAFVIHAEDQEGHSVLSLDRARTERTWRQLEKQFETGECVETEVANYNKGGLLVNLGGVRGFVPASQVVGINIADENSKQSAMANVIGTRLCLKIIEINRSRNRLILSQRQAMQEQRDLRKEKLLAELHEGQIRRGTVTSICDFGAFVDIGGADGLVHLSELSWSRINHPSEVLKVGDQIDVMVLKVDEAEKKIALSLKRTKPEPWTRVADKYHVGQKVKATITQLASFGAFAKIEDGVEGLIHISELAEGHVAHPRNVVQEGDEVEVCIIRIEPDKRRIGLSLRRAQEGGCEDQAEEMAPAENTDQAEDADQATE
jgi:small subunit ribosomal protein S1